jgi:flagellar M-ring protein FliF
MADAAKAGKALATTNAAAAKSASQGSSLDRVGALAGDVRNRFMAMPPGRRHWMLASVLMVLALCSAMMWYAGRTDWRVLFSGLDSKDTQQIAQELTAANIPYRMTDDGSGIEVGADQMDKARIEVASKGMPQSGRMGFELFDKPNWVGSEFDEKVNYQRAMEGELEHTIDTVAVVRTARVHLVLPKDSLFGEAQTPAKASVVLQLKRPMIPPDQIEAIRALVAGAVENLNPADVTLVDADGRLNLNAPTQGAQEGNEEHALEDKLVAMLEPTAGGGNVRATVNVSYDDSSVEKTDEVYDPAQVAPLTTHKSEQSRDTKARTSGVPGTASNTPGASAPGSAQATGGKAPAETTAATPPLLAGATTQAATAQSKAGLPVYPQSGAQDGVETSSDESSSYAVSKHLLHTEQGPGRIRRVTAAVVVNDRMSIEGAGKTEHAVWKPRSPEEMKRLEDLARAAVGFDTSRGDEVVVENVGFSSNMPVAQGTAMQRIMDQISSFLSAQPGLMKMFGVCVLGMLLVFMVLKPMTRQMMVMMKESPALALQAGPSGRGAVDSRGLSMRAIPGQNLTGQSMFEDTGRASEARSVYDHVSDHIRREPAESTRLLETWIGDSGEVE